MLRENKIYSIGKPPVFPFVKNHKTRFHYSEIQIPFARSCSKLLRKTKICIKLGSLVVTILFKFLPKFPSYLTTGSIFVTRKYALNLLEITSYRNYRCVHLARTGWSKVMVGPKLQIFLKMTVKIR